MAEPYVKLRGGTAAQADSYDFGAFELGILEDGSGNPTGLAIGTGTGGEGEYVPLTRQAESITVAFTPDNYDPASANVEANFVALDDALGEGTDLDPHEYAAANAAGTALEPRADKRPNFAFSIAAPAGETLAETGSISMLAGDWPAALSAVRCASVGDTVDVQISKNGSPINGFGSAQEITSTPADLVSTETFSGGELVTLSWSSGGSSLTGIAITPKAVRTGD